MGGGKMRILSYFLPFLFCISAAAAQDIYEITAFPFFEEGTSISSQDLETFQEIFVQEAVAYSPSVMVTSRGPLGRQGDFSLRGARASQNLLLVDGIPANDPAAGGGIDLASFLNADLERIEIISGPQNLAYGPGALGGVLQLTPHRGMGKPSLTFRGEKGSFKTSYGMLRAQGEEGPLTFSATALGLTRGPSSFLNPLHGNRQGDAYRNSTFSSRVGYAVRDNWEVEGVVRYTTGKVQFDELQQQRGDFLPFEAQNFTHTQTLLTSLESRWGGEERDHSLKASYTEIQRKTEMPSFLKSTVGQHPLLSYRTEWRLAEQHTLLGGLEGGQERAKIPELFKRAHGGTFLLYTFKPKTSTALTGGVRMDRYHSLKSRVTFRVGSQHALTPSTLVRTGYGTNFKPPSLSDLFQTLPWQIPNPFLRPEASQSFDIGVDQDFFKKALKASVTGFFTKINHMNLSRQMPNGSWQRFNGEHRFTRGLEMALALKPLKTLHLKAALTLTHARDYPGASKSPLLPSFKGAGEIHWQALQDVSFFLQLYGLSARKDSMTSHKLAPYGILTLGGAYTLHPQASLFWRVENVGDKRYEEVFGYGMRGRAFFIGIDATAFLL